MMKLIECPRDAMQGVQPFIATDLKIRYLNQLLAVGFDTLDFGSFVSPKAIPQMRDTAEVLSQLDTTVSATKLLAIVANPRGAAEAAKHRQITYIGYPFSVSETFQLRNTNATIDESLDRVKEIATISSQAGKSLVIYLSMGFGNPYGDAWNVDIVRRWVDTMAVLGIRIVALSDTIGVSTPASITYLFRNLIPHYPNIEFGAHLHTTPSTWFEKVDAAYSSGCRRFDGTINGYGGCPMAKDELTGNMATENLISYLDERKIAHGLNMQALNQAIQIAREVFP